MFGMPFALVKKLFERLEISPDVILEAKLGVVDELKVSQAGLGSIDKPGLGVGGNSRPNTPRSVRVLRARSAQPALAAGLAGLGWTRNLT